MSKNQDLIPPDVQEAVEEMRIRSALRSEQIRIGGERVGFFNPSVCRLQLLGPRNLDIERLMAAFKAQTGWDLTYPGFKFVFTKSTSFIQKGTALIEEGSLTVPETGIMFQVTTDVEVE